MALIDPTPIAGETDEQYSARIQALAKEKLSEKSIPVDREWIEAAALASEISHFGDLAPKGSIRKKVRN